MLYAPEKMPRVARDDMNLTHEEEVALVNRIAEAIDAIEQGGDPATLDPLLDEWLEHTRAHFDNEHAIMEACGFPAYAVHRAEHERVFGVLTSVIDRYRNGNDLAPLKQFVTSTWPSWFDNHVNTMDFATAHFANMAEQQGKPF